MTTKKKGRQMIRSKIRKDLVLSPFHLISGILLPPAYCQCQAQFSPCPINISILKFLLCQKLHQLAPQNLGSVLCPLLITQISGSQPFWLHGQPVARGEWSGWFHVCNLAPAHAYVKLCAFAGYLRSPLPSRRQTSTGVGDP